MPRTVIVLLLALLLPAAAFTAVVPLTGETVLAVAPDPDYSLSPPAAAGRGSGFVVAWTSSFARYPGGSQLTDWGGGVEARRVGTDGQPEGARLVLVPEVHKMDLSQPALATDPSGRYAVVWSSAPERHPHITHWLRQFSPMGAPVSTTRLDRYPPPAFAGQEEPSAVAFGTAGRTFAVWPRPQPSRVEQTGLFGQVLLPSRQPFTPRFQVTARAVSQRHPQLDSDSRGNFVLVYHNVGPNSRAAVYLRRYDRNGRPAGGDLRLSPPGRSQGNPSLDVDPGGRFVVAWQEGVGIRAQFFDPPARPAGPAFEVHTGSRFAFLPDVALAPDGTVLVAWRELDADNGNPLVWARAFDAAGTALGERFRVDEDREPFANALGVSGGRPAVAASESGTFLVAWETYDVNPEGFRSTVVSRLYGVTD